MSNSSTPAVVLDANIICSDYSLTGRVLRYLQDACASGAYRLFIPHCVYDESIHRFAKDIQEAADLASKAWNKVNRSLPTYNNEPWAVAQIQLFRERLDRYVKSHNISICHYPNVSHSDALARASRRRKPFADNGSGYKDFLVWRSVLEVANANDNCHTYLLSRNHKDFAVTESDECAHLLHPDCIADLIENGLKEDTVILVTDIDTFIDVHIRPYLDSDEALAYQINNNTHKTIRLSALLNEHVLSQLKWTEIDPHKYDLPREYESARIVSNVIVDTGKATSITKSVASKQIVIEGKFFVESEIEGMVFRDDYWSSGLKGIAVNEFYFEVTCYKELDVYYSITLEDTGKEIVNVEIVDICLA